MGKYKDYLLLLDKVSDIIIASVNVIDVNEADNVAERFNDEYNIYSWRK